MNKDVFKTVGAILLILVIVGGTFWYGSQQRSRQANQVEQQEQQASRDESSEEASTSQSGKSEEKGAEVAVTIGQPQPTTIPDTGSEAAALIPVGLILGMYYFKRSSQKALYRKLVAGS